MENNFNKTLFGYKDLFKEFVDIFNSNSLPNKILLSGKKGIGKCTFANHFINYIFSKNDEFKYNLDKNEIDINNKSYKLINSYTHPNFFKISLNKEKKNIDILQVREMINFANKSTFNNKEKIILIDDCEYLNKNSSNALLKIIEEPNNDLLFLLIFDSQKKITNTLKSRCVEFKFNLNIEYIGEIVNSVFKENIFNKISKDFIYYSNSPLNYINFINLCNSFNLDYTKIEIDELIKFILKNKLIIKKNLSNDDIKYYLDIFFLKKIELIKNNYYFDLFSYFNKKYRLISKFNLDFDSYLLEFKSKMINE
tara:strand:+ start:473 stop:1402 length:930 start_codon:yes stop_codon:yes gene_type:complete